MYQPPPRSFYKGRLLATKSGCRWPSRLSEDGKVQAIVRRLRVLIVATLLVGATAVGPGHEANAFSSNVFINTERKVHSVNHVRPFYDMRKSITEIGMIIFRCIRAAVGDATDDIDWKSASLRRNDCRAYFTYSDDRRICFVIRKQHDLTAVSGFRTGKSLDLFGVKYPSALGCHSNSDICGRSFSYIFYDQFWDKAGKALFEGIIVMPDNASRNYCELNPRPLIIQSNFQLPLSNVSLPLGLAIGKLSCNDSEDRQPECNSGKSVAAVFKSFLPIPMRLLFGAMLSLAGMIICVYGPFWVGYVLGGIGALLWLPALISIF